MWRRYRRPFRMNSSQYQPNGKSVYFSGKSRHYQRIETKILEIFRSQYSSRFSLSNHKTVKGVNFFLRSWYFAHNTHIQRRVIYFYVICTQKCRLNWVRFSSLWNDILRKLVFFPQLRHQEQCMKKPSRTEIECKVHYFTRDFTPKNMFFLFLFFWRKVSSKS